MASEELDLAELSSAKRRKKSSVKKSEASVKKRKRKSDDERPRKKKRKRKSEDERPRKKKRDSSSKDKPRKRKTITELVEATELDNEFTKSYEALSVEERSQMEEYIYMFKSLSKISRNWTDRVNSEKSNSRDVYALLKIYDQMRELVADLKALKDMGEVASIIQDDVMNPLMRDVAGSISGIKSEILEQFSEEPELSKRVASCLDRALRNVAYDVQESYVNSSNNLRNVLAGI